MLNLILAAKVDVAPNPTGLPGSAAASQMTNGLAWYALIFCLVGVLLSAGLWAVGAFSNNYTQSVNGKKGFLICAGAAIAIGAATNLVDWFSSLGSSKVK